MLAHAHEVVHRADRELDARPLPEVVTGLLLEATRTTYELTRAQRRRSTDTPLGEFTFRPVAVWATISGRYPETAFVESRVAGRRYQQYRGLHQLVRTGPRSGWRIALAVYPEADRLVRPRAGPDGVTAAAAGSQAVGGVRPDRLSTTLARALDRPSSSAAATFRGQPRRDRFAATVADPGDGIRREVRFFPRREVAVMLAGDGGGVALVGLAHLRTDRAARGYVVTVRRPYDRAYPGEYRELSQGSLDTCLVRLPPTGRAEVVVCDEVQGQLTAA